MRIILNPISAFSLLGLIIATAGVAVVRNRPAEPAPPVVALAAVPAPAASGTMPIFCGVTAPGWDLSWSWTKTFDPYCASPTHDHPHSLRVTYGKGEGLKFHHAAINTAGYNRISLFLYGGSADNQGPFTLEACENEKDSPRAVLIPVLPKNKWVEVTVPLTMLSVDNKPDVTSFWLSNTSERPGIKIYVDDVQLLPANTPAPAGETLEVSAK